MANEPVQAGPHDDAIVKVLDASPEGAGAWFKHAAVMIGTSVLHLVTWFAAHPVSLGAFIADCKGGDIAGGMIVLLDAYHESQPGI